MRLTALRGLVGWWPSLPLHFFIGAAIMGITFTFGMGQLVHHTRTGLEGSVEALMIDRDDIRWALFEHVTIVQQELKSKWIRENDLTAV